MTFLCNLRADLFGAALILTGLSGRVPDCCLYQELLCIGRIANEKRLADQPVHGYAVSILLIKLIDLYGNDHLTSSIATWNPSNP